MDLTGKRYVVTGSATGMGAATTKAYVRAGAHVVGLYRNRGPEAVAADLEGATGTVRFLRCDVSDKTQMFGAIEEAVGMLGGLDGLVHAAAIAPTTPAENLTLEQIDEVLAINVRGTMLANQAAFAHLKERGGRIINFGSAAGALGVAMKADYAASKGAVHAWSRSVAQAWGKYGISVNMVCPVIMTDMYRATRASMTPDQLAEHDAGLRTGIPLGGAFGDPDRDFAPVMVFLASDSARFMTGQMINVDGGVLMSR